jgi:YfiH family protein
MDRKRDGRGETQAEEHTLDHDSSIAPGTAHGNRPWLVSPLLAAVPGLLHGFGTRQAGDVAEPGTTDLLRASFRARRLLLLRQVHGTAVAPPIESDDRPEADAWAGIPGRGVLLGILTADCLPVLLCHPPSSALGAAHAGWRGAVAGVAEATLKALEAPAEEVRAALGPCIGPCCYQVGPDVADAVGETMRLTGWPGRADRFRFDLRGFVGDRLLAHGLNPDHIETSPLCTACRPDLFFSFRRDGSTGRLCSFLGWARGTRTEERAA